MLRNTVHYVSIIIRKTLCVFAVRFDPVAVAIGARIIAKKQTADSDI